MIRPAAEWWHFDEYLRMCYKSLIKWHLDYYIIKLTTASSRTRLTTGIDCNSVWNSFSTLYSSHFRSCSVKTSHVESKKVQQMKRMKTIEHTITHAWRLFSNCDVLAIYNYVHTQSLGVSWLANSWFLYTQINRDTSWVNTSEGSDCSMI